MRIQVVICGLLVSILAICARAVDSDVSPVTKTAVIAVGSRDVVITAYVENVADPIDYQLKCVAAGAGCDGPAVGVPVSGVFKPDDTQITGVVNGLQPGTDYDCYVVVYENVCDRTLTVETEPTLYVASWGSLGNNTPSGDILACDVAYSVGNSQSSIGPCSATPSIANGNDSYPYSISVQGSRVFYVYYYRPETTGVLSCDVTENGTLLTNCVDAYGPASAGEEERYVSDIEIVGDSVYLGLENGEVLLCSILSNGSFADCDSAGPVVEGFVSFYRKRKTMYLVGSNITACSITSNGSLDTCRLAYSPGSDELWAMAIQRNRAYVTVNNGTSPGVELCTVTSTGTLTDCSPTGSGITGPTGIVIAGNQAYISQYGSASVDGENNAEAFTCSILSNGELDNCIPEYLYSPSSGILDITV